MEQLIEFLLTQSPLVILMVTGYYVMLKEKKELKKESVSDRKSYRKDIKELQEAHAKEIRELNDYIREHDADFFKSIDKLCDALDNQK